MAWETRNGIGHYYTRSTRIGGRVVRVYVGTGPAAEAAAQADAAERRRRVAAQEADRRARSESGAISEAVERFSEAVCSLARLSFEAAGCHQHHRGEWRRKRG